MAYNHFRASVRSCIHAARKILMIENYKQYEKQLADVSCLHEHLELHFPAIMQVCTEVSIERGWWPIVYDAVAKISKFQHLDNSIQISQIKEKYGGLRFYYFASATEAYEAIDAIVHTAVNDTKLCCEACGATEKVTCSAHGGVWVKNYCDQCHNKRIH